MNRVEVPLKHLSASALSKSIKEPNTFYLTRLVFDRIKKELQGYPAAIGSSFDYFIKKVMIERMFPEKEPLLPELKSGIETRVKDALFYGKQISGTYQKWGCLQTEDWADIELWDTFTYCGVPIMVKIDAVVWEVINEVKRMIPLDFKVSGFVSGVSPKPGFARQFKNNGKEFPAHKKYYYDVPMHNIDMSFAKQLCTYGWRLGFSPNGVFEDFPGKIHMLCFTKTGNMSVNIYRGIITKELQEMTLNDYQTVWREVNDGTFVHRLASTKSRNLCYVASENESWI